MYSGGSSFHSRLTRKGAAMSHSSTPVANARASLQGKNVFKFLLLSFIGVLIFFIPVHEGKIPLVIFIGYARSIIGAGIESFSGTLIVALTVILALSYFTKNKLLQKYFEGVGVVRRTLFTISSIIALLVLTGADIGFIQHPKIGGNVLKMAGIVFLTIFIAGSLVSFIIRSGIVEFLSTLTEPIMRPVFKLPGRAAVDMLSSFVASAAVGVYFTSLYYEKKAYTQRQACAVVTNFSVISLGYIGVLASLAGLTSMYDTFIIASFIIVFIMGAIMVRIPPISLINDRCIDGSEADYLPEKMSFKERFDHAISEGVHRGKDFTIKDFYENLLTSFKFAHQTICVLVAIATTVLTLVYYTSVFKYLGIPFAPILQALGIPNAEIIAPSVLIGIVEVTLPTLLLVGSGVAQEASFFIVLLSICQIIFFTECGTAILGSKIPLSPWKLILIFLVRTALAIPLVAAATHIIF